MTTSPTTVAWCTERNHPWSTYNPWADQTWCRCGQRTAGGQQEIDLRALHEIHHTCDYDAPGSCRCYVEADALARPVLGLPAESAAADLVERKRARRVETFAAKFAADTVCAEPPRYVKPTNTNLRRAFANCGRPPDADLYDDIRAAFAPICAARLADRVRPVVVFEVDQARIDAPAFPRPLSWWLRFVPMWATTSEGPGGTIRVAVDGRKASRDALARWLYAAGGRMADAVTELDRDAVGLIHRRPPLVALHARRDVWDALSVDARAACQETDHDLFRCPHHAEPYPPHGH